jgi:hypothetical protein
MGDHMKILVGKKPLSVTLPVSKTNFNRMRFGTKTKAAVLQLEGYDVDARRGSVSVDSRDYHLNSVELYPKKKLEVVPIKEAG